jgi:hypothetical protein
MSATTAVWSIPVGPKVATAVDVRTADQGERCPACRMYVTNSMPDCRCS